MLHKHIQGDLFEFRPHFILFNINITEVKALGNLENFNIYRVHLPELNRSGQYSLTTKRTHENLIVRSDSQEIHRF